MKDKVSDNVGNAAPNGLNLDMLIKILQQDVYVWEFINSNCQFSSKSVELLNEIILEMNGKKTKKLTEMIYMFGSMLEKQDLIARQLFIWMSLLLEEH